MKITINGSVYEGKQGQTILQLALQNNIYIPTLCYHPRTKKAGYCRICVVEIEGMGDSLQVSCSTEISDGMIVHTETERINETRKLITELYLSNGSHNCINCESCGKCELQDIAYRLGIEASSLPIEPTDFKIDEDNPFIIKDMNKCIRCFRCINACQSVVVNDVLAMGYRGAESVVIVDDDIKYKDSSCVFCGECIQLCPVGALTEKKSFKKGRIWETRKVRTTCPYCGVGCQINLHVKDNKIIRVTGVDGVPPNEGNLCLKGRFAYDFVNHTDRLKSPMIRKNGELVHVTWNEALDYTSKRLSEIKKNYGPDSIAGISCARSTNENNFAMMKFMRAVIGTNNLDHCART